MSTNREIPISPRDNADSLPYMLYRSLFSYEYAEHPVSFYNEGLLAGQQLIGRNFTRNDVIADIGSSNGIKAIRAVIECGIAASLVCCEPDIEAIDGYQRLPEQYRNRTSFVRTVGEALPFKTNSLQGLTMHNVIFRATSDATMLKEATRVVEPGGFIALSTNMRGQAPRRHGFERKIAKEVIRRTGDNFTIPQPPAEGHYLKDMPGLVQRVGNVSIIESLGIQQISRSIITEGEALEDYLESLRFSAANTDIPDAHREVWRTVVDDTIQPDILAEIARSAQDTSDPLVAHVGPYFSDPIRRGMIVLQVTT